MELFKALKSQIEYLQAWGIKYVYTTESIKKFLQSKGEDLGESDWDALQNAVLSCKKCSLHRVRKRPVWGEGSSENRLMLVSEYPSPDEDFYGKPFVGSVGNLLNRMLLAIGLRKEDFFITPAVKCKTPGGRPPDEEEVSACKPYLIKQIKLLKPKLILAMGFTPPKMFFEKGTTFSAIRGKVFYFKDEVPVFFTYHPAYVLKNPAIKRVVWEDLQEFKKLVEKVLNQ